MKNSIIGILSFAILFILVGCTSSKAEENFKDVGNDAWYLEDLKILLDKKIVDGYSDGTFRPEDTLTRDMFIKLMVTALGHTDVENASQYWALNYIDKAYEINLISEIGEYDSFKQPITREEMASIIERVLHFNEYFEGYELAKKNIKDYDKIEDNFKQGVFKTYYSGIITGYTDGEFKPKNVLTRSESVAAISRVLNENKRTFARTLNNEEIKKMQDFGRDSIVTSINEENYIADEKETDFVESTKRIKEIEKNNNINIIILAKKYIQQLAYNIDLQAFVEEREEYNKLFNELLGVERKENEIILSLAKERMFSKMIEDKEQKAISYFETDNNLIYLSSQGTIKVMGKVTLKYRDYSSEQFKSTEDVKYIEVEITKDKSGKYVIVGHVEFIEEDGE